MIQCGPSQGACLLWKPHTSHNRILQSKFHCWYDQFEQVLELSEHIQAYSTVGFDDNITLACLRIISRTNPWLYFESATRNSMHLNQNTGSSTKGIHVLEEQHQKLHNNFNQPSPNPRNRPQDKENRASRPLSHTKDLCRHVSSWVGDHQRIRAVDCFLVFGFCGFGAGVLLRLGVVGAVYTLNRNLDRGIG